MILSTVIKNIQDHVADGSSAEEGVDKVVGSASAAITAAGNQLNPSTEKPSLSKKRITQIIDAVTWIPRFVFAVLRLLPMFIIFGIGSIFHRSNYLEPKIITNNRTPVILIHGSGANQRQWDVIRPFFKSKETGHIFSLNLNDKAMGNDQKSIDEYARDRLAEKINTLKEKYLEAGIQLEEIILVGHSMGSLVGADYALNHAENGGVKVNTLVSISSPWEGSRLADRVYDTEQKPEGAFVTTNQERIDLKNKLIAKERAGEINVYTFSSSFDPMVRPRSSRLPLSPQCQMHSKIHDHYSAMMDPFLTTRMRKQWIVPNTHILPCAHGAWIHSRAHTSHTSQLSS